MSTAFRWQAESKKISFIDISYSVSVSRSENLYLSVLVPLGLTILVACSPPCCTPKDYLSEVLSSRKRGFTIIFVIIYISLLQPLQCWRFGPHDFRLVSLISCRSKTHVPPCSTSKDCLSWIARRGKRGVECQTFAIANSDIPASQENPGFPLTFPDLPAAILFLIVFKKLPSSEKKS